VEFKEIKKVNCGNFLNRYDICYQTPEGGEKVYEMFSRDREIDSEDKLKHPRTDAVIIIATDKEREHLLMIREFRLELNREIYGLPAGLIDPGETPEETAARELKEETGLDLIEVRDVMPPSYCAVGLSNEKAICVFGIAEGKIAPNKSTGEEITAQWYTKSELSELVRNETFGSWAQAYTYMWTKGF
jgi:ADP-ribose pyrophosphatase